MDFQLPSGPFQPTWDSLANYKAPAWYQDAKFGIFIHWGIYSVPAFGSEWYSRNMYKQGTPEFEHHVKTYGTQDKFGYKDFIPKLTFEKYDPEAFAQLFEEAGAKFIVPVAEHHDGFAMYDTELSPWSAAKMGPKRDVLGELAKALRKRGLVFALSSHRAEHFWFFDEGKKFTSDVQDPANESLYGPAEPAPSDWMNPELSPPTEEYMDDWFARCIELVDKYKPSVFWFDWWIQNIAFKPYLQKFAAYYYNRAAEWGTEVAINYKDEAFPNGTAIFDVERGQLAGIHPMLWQNDTAVSRNSWGYIQGHDYKSVQDILCDLIDVVSKNGAMLLNVGPKPDGTIPDHEQAMLREIGAWLKLNGEAIYGTRPWRTFGEGPTKVEKGSFTDGKRPMFTGQDLRFTAGNGNVYILAMAWPGEKLVVKSLGSSLRVTEVELIGYPHRLAWHQDDHGLHISLPTEPVGEHAFVFRAKPV
jgi:alpha-L-fucosidase